MNEKTRDDVADASGLNPAGAARRRLLKAAGLAAVASTIAVDWQRPAIRLGGLPAHAQATTQDCTMSFTVTADVTDTAASGYTLSLISEMSVATETNWTGASQPTLSTSVALLVSDGSTHFWRVDHIRPAGFTFAFDWSGECCGSSNSGRVTYASNEVGNQLFQAQLNDPGVCGFGISVPS